MVLGQGGYLLQHPECTSASPVANNVPYRTTWGCQNATAVPKTKNPNAVQWKAVLASGHCRDLLSGAVGTQGSRGRWSADPKVLPPAEHWEGETSWQLQWREREGSLLCSKVCRHVAYVLLCGEGEGMESLDEGRQKREKSGGISSGVLSNPMKWLKLNVFPVQYH